MEGDLDAAQTGWLGYSCPECHTLFRVRAVFRGREVECPNCARVARIPAPEPGQEQAQAATAAVSEGPGEETPLKEFRRWEKMEEGKESSSEGRRIRRRVVKEPEEPEEFGWELEDRRGSSAHGTPLKPLRPVLFGALAVLILMVGVVTSFMLARDRQGPEQNGGWEQQKMFQLSIREETLDAVEEVENTDMKVEMRKIDNLVKEFLGAKTVEEVLACTRRDPGLEQKIREYYQTHRLSPVIPKTVAAGGRVLRNRGFWAVDVILPDHSVKPIAAKWEDDRYTIDWESWVGYSEVPWGEVRKIRPKEPALFRVLCSSVQYFNFGFSDDRKWRSYRLQSPDRKHTLYGYVERFSIQESMLTPLNVESGQVRAYILRIRFTDDSGPDQVVIEEVVEPGWVRAGADESVPARALE